MSDRPGEHKPRESAAAVRDAEARLRSKESQDAIGAAFGGDDDPRGLNEPDDDDDAVAGDDRGEDPEPAEPDGEQGEGDDEGRSDYDPEDAAQYPDDKDKTPEPPPDSEPQDKPTISEEDRQLLDRYSDDESRLEALRELERLKGGGQQEPSTQETETEQQRFTPRPGQEPTDENLKTVLEELRDTDPSVQRAIDELTEVRTQLTADAEAFTKSDETLGTLAREVSDLEAIQRHTQTRLERISDDDPVAKESLQEELAGVTRDLNEARHKQQRAENDRFRLERDNSQRRSSYELGVEELRNIGYQEYSSRAQQVQDQDDRKQAYDAAKREKDAALPRVMEKLKIPKSLEAEFRDDIGAAADRLSDEEAETELAPGRIEGWMERAGQRIQEKYQRYAEATVRGYVQNKLDDTNQPAPAQPRTGKRQKRDRPLTAREMDRQAGKQIRQSLGGGRA